MNYARHLIAIILLFLSTFLSAQGSVLNEDKFVELQLRMLGHKVLLQAGDTSSRVLPIVKRGEDYEITFDSEFSLEPSYLVDASYQLIKAEYPNRAYMIRVLGCTDTATVYSFLVRDTSKNDIVPCRSRPLVKSCYKVLFTFVSLQEQAGSNETALYQSKEEPKNLWLILVLLFVLFGGISWVLVRYKNKKHKGPNPHQLPLGNYLFDKNRAELILKEQRIELTGKESDLLLLLYNAANTTVERELILNEVWGDEGDYVGRTLDVFISKLRKKLEADPSVKIVNIRGVGYKLVLG